MAPRRPQSQPSGSLSSRIPNKLNRQAAFVKEKKARDSAKRQVRFARKRQEDKDPSLRTERLLRNKPITIDSKRVWDDGDEDAEGVLGASVEVGRPKRRRIEEDVPPWASTPQSKDADSREGGNAEDDLDSILDSVESSDENEDEAPQRRDRAPSPAPSTTSTNLTLTPEALASKFPMLFTSDTPPAPKILITTSLNSSLYYEAELLTSLFPNSVFIRRSSHRYGHKFSVREITKFASNRNFTALVVLKEDLKRPTGLSITNLPVGPTLHFSITNWVEGKKLPGHGQPTEHLPELILNNFRTPLGLLTAQLFRRLFPDAPEVKGRQVVTLHNQRDYIFLRRHRYVFRDKREREKSVVGPDGKVVKGVQDIRVGLQELGPRFTLKLRRVDKGVGRADGDIEWEWKSRMDKVRTRFQL
ncbi:MAG: hypothetical protein M1814_000623 [Vezdaea aestivalis]|nr:MAG: hypothetical protein M1814_000623 [Vezdaea aestivalis]